MYGIGIGMRLQQGFAEFYPDKIPMQARIGAQAPTGLRARPVPARQTVAVIRASQFENVELQPPDVSEIIINGLFDVMTHVADVRHQHRDFRRPCSPSSGSARHSRPAQTLQS